MIGKIFKNILGNRPTVARTWTAPPPATASATTRSSARRPARNASSKAPGKIFGFLGAGRRDLPGRVTHYVLTGQDADVIKSVRSVCGQSVNYETHHRPYDAAALRATYAFGQYLGDNPGAVARYTLVRACTASSRLQTGAFYGHPWIADAPAQVKLLLSLLTERSGTRTDLPDPDAFERTSVRAVIEAVKGIGGSEADLVAWSLPMRPRAPLNRLFLDDRQDAFWAAIPVDALINALGRCDAKIRAAMIERPQDIPMLLDPCILPYLIEQAQSGSKTVRLAVRGLLARHAAQDVVPLVLPMLASRKAAAREEAVHILGPIDSDESRTALTDLQAREKSASVMSALEVYRQTSEQVPEVPSDANGYMDVFGTYVTVDQPEPLAKITSLPLGDAVKQAFAEVEANIDSEAMEKYQRKLARWKDAGHNQRPAPPKPSRLGQQWLDFLNWDPEGDVPKGAVLNVHVPYSQANSVHPIVVDAVRDMPVRRMVQLAVVYEKSVQKILHPSLMNPLGSCVYAAIQDGRVTVPQVLAIASEHGIRVGYGYASEGETTGLLERDFIQFLLRKSDAFGRTDPALVKDHWTLAVPYLDDVLQALPPRSVDRDENLNALNLLATFPTLPDRMVQAVFMAALSNQKEVQQLGQLLLREVPGIDGQLAGMLADSKQDIRSRAARFLGERGATDALPALAKRLKSEKSDLARSDMISAVQQLGGDTSPYLGRDALLKEAQIYVAKLSNSKIDWLPLHQAPSLVWADGQPAEPVLLDGWLRLAIKLNAPKGIPLFGMYLDQMTPDSARAVADWLLWMWLTYDFENRPGHAASKGILALTHRATPSTAGPLMSTFLKKHGAQVSQAKALLETAFGMGSDEAVQILVSTATRFKQRSVLDLAGVLVKELANQRNWSEDELADRSVPTGGFDMARQLRLEVGPEAKPYLARLTTSMTVELSNPAGKIVKSLPTGDDEPTKTAKAALSAAKKTLKATTTRQSARLYEAMLSGRQWTRAAWDRDLMGHPVMGVLVTGVIWRGLDEQGADMGRFRPTPEGEFLDAEGDDVDLASFARIDIAHAAVMSPEDVQAWQAHIKDFEVKPLFAQVSRPVLALPDTLASQSRLMDREGWMISTLRLRSAAQKAGFDRGPAEDSGWISRYRKALHGCGLMAELHFSGTHAVEQDIRAALYHMQFVPIDRGDYGQPVRLADVPPIVLSEIWNDLHAIAGQGAFDPDWKNKVDY